MGEGREVQRGQEGWRAQGREGGGRGSREKRIKLKKKKKAGGKGKFYILVLFYMNR